MSEDVAQDTIKLDLYVPLVLLDALSVKLHLFALFVKMEDMPLTVNATLTVLLVLLLTLVTLLVLPVTPHAQLVLNIHQNVYHVSLILDICSTLNA